MKITARRATLAAALPLIAAILEYGYWFNRTHGALLVSVTDLSDRAHPRDFPSVQLTFLDGSGKELAGAESVPPFEAIILTSPSSFACLEAERRAPYSADARQQWDNCFERQSRWLPTWIRDVRAVNLHSDGCVIERLPVTVSEFPDNWWLWWVPLRHIGGKPYTSFSVQIQIDRNTACGGRSRSAEASTLKPTGTFQ